MVTFVYDCASGDGMKLEIEGFQNYVGLVHLPIDEDMEDDTAVHVANEDAPEVAAAILRQAGIKPVAFGSYAEQGLHYLMSYVNERRIRREEQEKREQQARARYLEAAALRLLNTARKESGFGAVETFDSEGVLHLYLSLASEAEAIFAPAAAA